MHKQESIQENQMYEILWEFEIQTDLLIPIRRLDRVLINKKKVIFILWTMEGKWKKAKR